MLDSLIDTDRYEHWQRSIIFEKNRYRDPDGDEAVAARRSAALRQEQLHAAVEDGQAATSAYLFAELGVKDRDRAVEEVPTLPNPLTPGEMSSLPIFAERQLDKHLGESFSPAQAAQPALWTLCHAVWISQEIFGSNLSVVFLEGPKANTSEARTRNLLRRTGGLRRVRGNTSPLTDCPISAAWWRCRIAEDVSNVAQTEGEDLDAREAHTVLHHKEVWANLVNMSLKQVTAVSAPRARAAAVAALGRCQLDSAQKVLRAQVQSAIRHLAHLSHGHSLEFAPWSQLLRVAEEGISRAGADDTIADEDDSDTDD